MEEKKHKSNKVKLGTAATAAAFVFGGWIPAIAVGVAYITVDTLYK